MSEQLAMPGMPMPDPGREMVGRYHQAGPATERETATRIAPRTGSQRLKVLQALQDAGDKGCTDYELHAHHHIGARPHVPGSRRGELIADGWKIVDSGRRRRTDTGNRAIVWVLTP